MQPALHRDRGIRLFRPRTALSRGFRRTAGSPPEPEGQPRPTETWKRPRFVLDQPVFQDAESAAAASRAHILGNSSTVEQRTSDSVNLGSNPSSPANKKHRYFLHNSGVFDPRKSRNSRNGACTAAAQNSAQCRCRGNRAHIDHLRLGEQCGKHALRGHFGVRSAQKSAQSLSFGACRFPCRSIDRIGCGCCRRGRA